MFIIDDLILAAMATVPNLLGAGATAAGTAATAAGASSLGATLGSAGAGLSGLGGSIAGAAGGLGSGLGGAIGLGGSGGLLSASSPLAAAETSALAAGAPLELGASGLGSLSTSTPSFVEAMGGAQQVGNTGLLGQISSPTLWKGMGQKTPQMLKMMQAYSQSQQPQQGGITMPPPVAPQQAQNVSLMSKQARTQQEIRKRRLEQMMGGQ